MKKFLAALLLAVSVFGLPAGADAADKIKAVASFSILGDMVKQVGGDRIDLATLVGPDGDAHVFEPTPADAKTLADAQILFVNGLGLRRLDGPLGEILRLQGQSRGRERRR